MTTTRIPSSYRGIEAHIHRAHAERALAVGEAIGTGLLAAGRALERVLHGWRVLFQPRAARKPA
jgi:hypothetical protein